MSNEDLSIIQEINEELKNDQQMEFLKKHKNAICSVIAVFVVGIFIYSSWHERRKKNMEDVTNALLEVLQNPTAQSASVVGKLIEDAPVELRPMLTIIKSGKELVIDESNENNLKPLLDLSQKNGVDQIWKDIAIIIYASYPTKPSSELISLLMPLTEANRPFRFTALEIIAMINANDGKYREAIDFFEKILANNEAPKTLKDRVSMLIAYIKDNHNIADNAEESKDNPADQKAE